MEDSKDHSVETVSLRYEDMVMPCIMVSHGPSLPLELWEQILHNLAEERNYDVIATCATVCRVFQHVCKKHLKDYLNFSSEEDVDSLKTNVATKEIGGWRGPERVSIIGEKGSHAIPHVATIASRFAGRWTRTERLYIAEASWPASLRAADAAVFTDLSRFTSITELDLYDVTFPSVVTFGALVSTLSSLEGLSLRDVKFAMSSFLFDPRMLSNFRLLPQPKRLQRIKLDLPGEFTPTVWLRYTEFLEFMIAVSNPHGKPPRVCPWGSVRRLEINESIWWRFSPSSMTRLLRILPSLEFLEFDNARRESSVMRITGFPAYPMLKPIDIRVETRTPQHVVTIVRSLIKMDYPLRITEIHALTFPISRETDSLAAAMNELVRHAGPSLEYLYLCIKGHEFDWAFKAFSDQYHHSDLSDSGNTPFESIRINHLRLFCIDACEILSHVASRRISSVSIDFDWFRWSDQGGLNDVFSQLDAALSLPVFDNLVHVSISVLLDQDEPDFHEKEMKDWVFLMKSCLASLDERGILGLKLSYGIKDEIYDQVLRPDVRLGLIWIHGIKDWKRFDSKRDEKGNIEIVEVAAFKGGAYSEAMAAHTAWKRSNR